MHVVVSGPEPGYVATALMFLAMARTVVDERTELPRGGVFTPAALVGGGGVKAVQRLVARLDKCGVRFTVAGGAGPAAGPAE